MLRRQLLVLGLTFATAGLCVYLLFNVNSGFFPQQDTGRINGMIQGDQDLSFAAMSQKVRVFSDILMHDPGVDNVSAFAGGGSGGSTARAFSPLQAEKRREKKSPRES